RRRAIGRLRPAVRLRPDGKLQDDALRLRQADRKVHRGMIEQVSRIIADRNLHGVDEGHVGRAAIVDVHETILPWAPEVARAIGRSSRAPTFLTRGYRP